MSKFSAVDALAEVKAYQELFKVFWVEQLLDIRDIDKLCQKYSGFSVEEIFDKQIETIGDRKPLSERAEKHVVEREKDGTPVLMNEKRDTGSQEIRKVIVRSFDKEGRKWVLATCPYCDESAEAVGIKQGNLNHACGELKFNFCKCDDKAKYRYSGSIDDCTEL